jgi:dihydroorotase
MNGGLENTVEQMDPQLCAQTIRKFPDFIVGVKTAHYYTDVAIPWDAVHTPWAAVDQAEECGRLANVPVMLDVWPRPGRTYAELILKKMRPGDIHTNVFGAQFPILLADGKLNPILPEARRRGVLFDVGHGAGSFWFRNAVPAAKQGFIPDSLSTDLFTGDFTFLSMTELMSKFLAMGVPLEDVVRRTTANPAREIRRLDLGTLSVGHEADVAVLEVLHGHFGYMDDGFARMDGKEKVVARMTIRAGRILYDPSGLSMVEWEKAPRQYFTVPESGSSPPARADNYPRN